MSLNSTLTNVAALQVHQNVGEANTAATAAIARLSSGHRITRAADDIASLSAGTSLQTNVVTLRTALLNTLQGVSLLEVADGGIAGIIDMLIRQKSIAVQAGSGSLTPSERGFLDQEFQQLKTEIDRIARETNFNDVPLLDGSLFDVTFLQHNTNIAKAAAATLTFSANVADQQTTILNGVTIEFDDANDGANNGGSLLVNTLAIAGGSIKQYVQAMADALNGATSNNLINTATYRAVGETLEIESRYGGEAGERYVINQGASATTFSMTQVRETNEAGFFVMNGGEEEGIAAGDVVGYGVIGDSIIAAQNQVRSFAALDYSNTVFTDFTDGLFIIFDDGDTVNAGNVTLEFDTSPTSALSAADHVRIDISNAATKDDVLDAITETINAFVGVRDDGTVTNDDYVFAQIEARRLGDRVIMETRDFGGLFHKDDPTVPQSTPIVTNVPNTILAGSPTFTNGVRSGVNTTGISNPEFLGTIQGFEAKYQGSDNIVQLRVQVGGRAYFSQNVNVSLANPQVRMLSAAGDFFTMDMRTALDSIPVQDQRGADLIAKRLDKAFETLTFFQNRDITSYKGVGDILTNGEPTGSLTGSSFTLQKDDFDRVIIDDVRVYAPLPGQSNAVIEVEIRPAIYRSEPVIGSDIGSRGALRLISLDNVNDVLTFRAGDITGLGLRRSDGTIVNSIEFDTKEKAKALQERLKKAFGIGDSGQVLNFQVGVQTADRLEIRIADVSTNGLYDGEALDVLTREAALHAGDVLDAALDRATLARAEVGSQQSRFDFAAANIESSIQNQEAASGTLLDTNIATEATDSANYQVKIQASITALAQANLLPENLLKLVS